jgi:uncharacterized membrane protein YgdD (TMEM256/DUF423 family)
VRARTADPDFPATPLGTREEFPNNGQMALDQRADSYRFPLFAAGFFGLTGVTLGALGAHAMAATLSARGMTHAWETASQYHLLHALALFAAALAVRSGGVVAPKLMLWAVRLWVAGILLFSGSLYVLAVGGPRWLGPVTPLGGIALIAGWLLVMLAALGRRG